MGLFIIVYLLFVVFLIISMWKVFEKAGQPGWAAIVPFYNLYVFTQIVQRPGWWMLLYFLAIIPIIGSLAVLVIVILDYIKLAEVFGKGGGFATGLILLGFVFIPILAFGDAQYKGLSSSSSDLLDQ